MDPSEGNIDCIVHQYTHSTLSDQMCGVNDEGVSVSDTLTNNVFVLTICMFYVIYTIGNMHNVLMTINTISQ